MLRYPRGRILFASPDSTYMAFTDKQIIEALNDGTGLGRLSLNEVIAEAADRGLIGKYKQLKYLVRHADGGTSGPHGADELKSRFLAGEISESTLVHVKSIMGWLPLGEVFDCSVWTLISSPKKGSSSSSKVRIPAMNWSNPASKWLEGLPKFAAIKSLAMNRLWFCVAFFTAVVTCFLVTSGFQTGSTYQVIAIGFYAVLMLATIALRLVDMNSSPLLALVLLVPLANLWLVGRCIACQTGYESAGRLDERGRTLFYLYIAAVIAAVLTAISHFML